MNKCKRRQYYEILAPSKNKSAEKSEIRSGRDVKPKQMFVLVLVHSVELVKLFASACFKADSAIVQSTNEARENSNASSGAKIQFGLIKI